MINFKTWSDGFYRMMPLFAVLAILIFLSLERASIINQQKELCIKDLQMFQEQQAELFQALKRACEGDGKQLVVKEVKPKNGIWDYNVRCK